MYRIIFCVLYFLYRNKGDPAVNAASAGGEVRESSLSAASQSVPSGRRAVSGEGQAQPSGAHRVMWRGRPQRQRREKERSPSSQLQPESSRPMERWPSMWRMAGSSRDSGVIRRWRALWGGGRPAPAGRPDRAPARSGRFGGRRRCSAVPAGERLPERSCPGSAAGGRERPSTGRGSGCASPPWRGRGRTPPYPAGQGSVPRQTDPWEGRASVRGGRMWR